MMIGDIGYNDLYYPSIEKLELLKNGSIVNGDVYIRSSTMEQYYPVTAQFMFAVLLLLLSIVMINVLLGFAVDDVGVCIFTVILNTIKNVC